MSFSNFLLSKKLAHFLVENVDPNPAETWLQNFKWNSIRGVVPQGNLLSDLRQNYGFKGSVYRPYTFFSQDQYDNFLKETNGGTSFTADYVTRWYPNKEKTSINARGGSKSDDYYRFSDDPWEQKKRDNADHMIGEFAIVVKIDVTGDEAFDTQFGQTHRESTDNRCIALMPGTYKMEIVEEHIPFVKAINSSNFKEKFMSIKSVGNTDFWDDDHNYERALFKHIIFHYKNFDAEMQSHLFDLMHKILVHCEYKIFVHDSFSDENFIHIEWTVPECFLYYVALLNNKQQKEFDNIIIGLFRKIDREFRQKTTKINWIEDTFKIRLDSSIAVALKLERYENHVHFAKFLIQKIQLVYQHLNSYEETRRINAIDDPLTKSRAIESIRKRIESALNQMKVFVVEK